MIGSPEFAAPEQTRGKPAFASDIYSLGVTCIHLLTNVPPFDLFDIGEDNWVWRDYLVNNPVDDVLGKVLDGSIVNALTRRYRSASDVLIKLKNQVKFTPAKSIPNYSPATAVSSILSQKSINYAIFSFEMVQLKKVSQQVASVRTVKKSGWLGLASKKVNENYTKTVDEWLIEKKLGQVRRFIEDLGNGIKIEMVVIPGGEFWMGSSATESGSGESERPQHLVSVPNFCMGRYPSTQAQYEALMGKNPSMFRGNSNSLPVEQVSWNDAQDFCRELNKRSQRKYGLPSEAQWEYACRAGTKTSFYFGETITSQIANYNGNYTYKSEEKGVYRSKPTPVGSFPPNGFGLNDMHGNVWEWCEDEWHENYQEAPTDGSVWINSKNNNFRLLRGGSWSIDPNYCRSAFRHRGAADVRDRNIGFRLVCALDL
jgi:formylglycine-generating enzyme required for sulfatase activity